MALISTAKWIVSSGPISRSEKFVGTCVISGLNYLAKEASKRGDFHEANHNIVAILAGNSMHEHGNNCIIPHDRMINPQEGSTLTERLKTQEGKEVALPGFYL